MENNAATRSAVKKLLLQIAGSDPIGQFSAESEIRRMGPGALPVISAVMAAGEKVSPFHLFKAVSYILGSGFLASFWEQVRRYRHLWTLMVVAAGTTGVLLLIGYLRLRDMAERMKTGAALAVQALGDPDGAAVLLEMMNRGQANHKVADVLASLLRRTYPGYMLFTEEQQEGLRKSLAYPHHELRMAALHLIGAIGDYGAIGPVSALARSRSRSVDALQERDEAARTLSELKARAAV